MKKKLNKNTNRFSSLMLVLLLSLMINVNFNGRQIVYASVSASETDVSISPFADITEWRYKVEGGKLYKRLYNCSSFTWIGEWILCS